MIRRRYRTIHVAQLDRVMAESEAIHRALSAGARRAWVHSTERIVDRSGLPVWQIVLRVTPRRRSRRRPAKRS